MDRHGDTGGIFGVVLIIRADWQDWQDWTVVGREFGETGIGDGLEFDEEA